MARNEKTSPKVATIAAKALRDPGSVTKPQIRTIAGSVLTQRPDKPNPPAQPQPQRRPKPKPKPPALAKAKKK